MYTWSPVKHTISFLLVIGLLIVWPASPFVPPFGIDSIPFESIPTQVLGAFDEVRVAYLPNNVDTAIAVGVAEALAGALGGIASRGTANVLGNRKKDSLQTKVQTTSAFFATRGLLRASGRVLGLPRPLTLVAASVLGSIASEATKKFGRIVDEQKRGNNTQDSREPLNILSGSEIAGDIMKWLSYDLLFQATAAKVMYPWEVPLSFVSGGAAAVIGLLVYDLLEKVRLREAFARSANNKYFPQHSKLPRSGANGAKRPAAAAVPSPLLRGMSSLVVYEQTAVEGAILFGVFQLVYDFLNKYLPEGARYEFPFYRALGAMEDDLLSGLQQSTMFLAHHAPTLPHL